MTNKDIKINLFGLLQCIWWGHSQITWKTSLEPWVLTDLRYGHSPHRINHKHPWYQIPSTRW